MLPHCLRGKFLKDSENQLRQSRELKNTQYFKVKNTKQYLVELNNAK